jgi:xylan 1,4-beta-xylosidase
VPVHLRVEVDYERLYFAYRLDGKDWNWLPGPLDASLLSDETGPVGNPNFTGCFVGMCCQDLAGARRRADFDYFYYRGREYLPDVKNSEFRNQDPE